MGGKKGKRVICHEKRVIERAWLHLFPFNLIEGIKDIPHT